MEAVEHTEAPAGETERALQGVYRYYELAKRAEWQGGGAWGGPGGGAGGSGGGGLRVLGVWEGGGGGGGRQGGGRAAADPRVQRLAAEARPPQGPLALGDHAAAAGRRARGRDGDAAL